MSFPSDHADFSIPDGVMSLDDVFPSDEKEMAGSRFLLDIVSAFQSAFLERKADGVTQQSLTDSLGLANRSIVNRWLKGRANMSARSMGELAWALNCRATFTLVPNGSGTSREVVLRPERLVTSDNASDLWARAKQEKVESQNWIKDYA